MKIAIIAHSYPCAGKPTAATFVRVIAHGFVAAGHEVVVVNPVPFPRALNRKAFPAQSVDDSVGFRIMELRPVYLSYSGKLQFPSLGVFNPARWSFYNFSRAAINVLKKIRFRPDVVYGHFLYFGGGGAIEVGRYFDVPSFIGVGEGEFWSVKALGDRFARAHLQRATGFFPNATHLGNSLAERFDIPKEKVTVLPNGIDPRLFYARDRVSSRIKFGIPEKAFIVGAVGNYNYKKGVCRVGEAIRGLKGVFGAFAGSGDSPPIANNIAFSARIDHSELPDFYSACDVFVLPTLIEGCCNSIIEAMACGLPVVSSNTKYTSDLLDETCSIRVDPLDVNAIRDAICKLKKDKALREHLSSGAIARSKNFYISERISKILGTFHNAITL